MLVLVIQLVLKYVLLIACEPECPVEAIFVEEDVPKEWDKFIDKNYEFFGQKRD